MKLFNEKIDVDERKVIIPDVLPSNLSELYNLYEIDDYSFNKLIEVSDNQRKVILSNEKNPSSSTMFKMLNKLNWTFSMIYDLNREVDIEYSSKIYEVLQLIKVDKNEEFSNFYYDVIEESLKEYKDDKTKLRLNYTKVAKDDKGKLFLNYHQLKFPISREKAAKLLQIAEDNKNDDVEFYIITANGYITKKTKMFIDTFSKFDVETNKLLLKLPYKSYNTVTVIKEDYIKIDKNNYVTKNKYKVLTDKGIKETDKFTKDLMNKNGELKIKCLSDKNLKNKLKLYRVIKNKSVQEMAEIFDMSVSSYKLMENDLNIFSTKAMWIIENVLGILLENMLDIKKFL